MNRRDLIKALAATGAALPFLSPGALLAQTADDPLLAAVHPELRQMAKAIMGMRQAMPQFSRESLPGIRAGSSRFTAKPTLDVPYEKRTIPGRAGQPDVTVFVVNGGREGSRPAILHTHGGGYITGSAESSIAELQKLCRTLDCVAVSVDYRLAPETTFAGSIEDNYAGLKWLHANAASLGIDPARIAVMGESAGGGHAALLALTARDRGEVPLAFQCLIYPMLDDRTGSSRQAPPHVGHIVWTAQSNRFGWESFLGTRPGQRRAPRGAVPARFASLAGLPPAWIGVGSIDLFHDEDVDYAQRLNAAGVPAELIVVPGAFHGFDMMPATIPLVQRFNESKLAALRSGLGNRRGLTNREMGEVPMTKTNTLRLRAALCAATMLASAPALAQEAAPAPPAASEPTLEEQFRDPPQSARPRVWWHWMNGNVTKDGIAKDFAWMKRVGIGGVQNFDAALQTPRVVEKPLIYMTPEWKDAFRFAASEADRLGLELAIAASPGWSETGGPWVPPEDGLKKLVWSETEVAGGRPFTGKLATPPQVTGPFQTVAKTGFATALSGEAVNQKIPQHYADVAVLAVPTPRAAVHAAPTIAAGDGKAIDQAKLTDADLQSAIELPRGTAANPASLTLTYRSPQTIRSASLFLPGAAMLFFGSNILPRLEASDDGASWRKVANIAAMQVPTTVGFAPVTARRFRFVFAPADQRLPFNSMSPGLDLVGLGAALGGAGAAAMAGGGALKVGDLRLSSEDRIDHYEAKAGFEVERDYYKLSQGVPDAAGIDPAKVIDLTRRMKPDGSLDWTPPAGRWRVLRLGASLLGTTNHPAPPEATGLEVDKFDGPAVRRYMEHYIDMYRDASGGLLGKRGVQAILTDSIEVGAANWTPRMVAQFKRLRGYDPTPWLPALTGAIVGSRAASDKFLYDYRRTLADLISSEHYGTVAAVAHEHGLKVYGEALENMRPSLGDDMAMRRHADIPMSAMWTHARKDGPQWSHVADIKGAASVAHIYGQNLVASESLTSSLAYWDHAPGYLKRIIDLAFVTGLNRPVIHTSVHQPLDDKFPGQSLFIFGQYFNRHEAWAEMARPWVDYLSRNALMLQQGRNLADVAYFFGEEAPLTALYEKAPVSGTPRANAWDFLNADALTGALANDGADLVTPGGARYRAIQLGGSSLMMTLPTLRRLAALVEGGATVVGLKPEADPSLAGDAAEFAELASKLWPGSDQARVGKGRVLAMTDIDAALRAIGVAPDFHFIGGGEGAKIPFVHRRLTDGDSYFLVNQLDRTETIEARFRVTGKAPELWRAETGKAEPVSYRTEGGETIVPLSLAADESVHVVFRKDAAAPSLTVERPAPVELAKIEGPWTVSFQPGRGAPAQASLPQLTPLNENADGGIKHFSGEATYTRDFVTPRGWRRGQPLWLNLGEVRELAEVAVNGKPAGAVWHAPWRVDVSAVAKPGRNRLSVKVANLWVNRLIGDAQPGAVKITWTALPTYRADAPLRPSGLIGPVTLEGAQR